ncbi:MAG: hypothetical protein ACKO0V_24985 [bacterium]
MQGNSLQTPGHEKVLKILRVAGPLIVVVGLVFMVIGLADFFSGDIPPQKFWCLFVGMPVMFVGLVICKFAFMGSILRFTMSQVTPVIKDTMRDMAPATAEVTNYMAENTKDAVKTMAKAVTEGVSEGMDATRDKQG